MNFARDGVAHRAIFSRARARLARVSVRGERAERRVHGANGNRRAFIRRWRVRPRDGTRRPGMSRGRPRGRARGRRRIAGDDAAKRPSLDERGGAGRGVWVGIRRGGSQENVQHHGRGVARATPGLKRGDVRLVLIHVEIKLRGEAREGVGGRGRVTSRTTRRVVGARVGRGASARGDSVAEGSGGVPIGSGAPSARVRSRRRRGATG